MKPLIAILCLFPAAALADPPEIVDARLDGGRLSVTLRHPDTGWDHYADAWELLDADGGSLGLRELTHPHVDEQPFTRSLAVDIPAGADITLRARCTVTGWSTPVQIPLD